MSRLYYCFFLVFLLAFEFALMAQDSNPKLISRLEVYSLSDGSRTVVYEEDGHFEAPNWGPDGRYWIINQGGHLFTVYQKGNRKERIPIQGLEQLNNDHGPSPDGKLLAISNNDEVDEQGSGTSRIYIVPLNGGNPVLVTPEMPSYWHGWSPDGKRLVYTAARKGVFDIYEMDIATQKEIQITNQPTLDDGPDYSADGNYLYFNSYRSGSMEIWRRSSKNGAFEQLTSDAYSNWFPHPSPDGKYMVFLSYVEDQKQGHPAMKKVRLRLMDLSNQEVRTICSFTGGQGTINVPSWAPDSSAFAFVSYETQ